MSMRMTKLALLWQHHRPGGARLLGQYLALSEPSQGLAYPQPFIFTTTKDDRVGPQHARKFVARMEEMGLPFYFYENTEGGHAAGANLKQAARTTALEYVYLTCKLMD